MRKSSVLSARTLRSYLYKGDETMQMITNNLKTLPKIRRVHVITMRSVQYFIIFNIFILLISASAGKSVSKQRIIRSYANDYSDEAEESSPENEDDDDGECHDITHYIICQHDGVSIVVEHGKTKGIFYVDGYGDDSKCRKELSSHKSSLNILFGHCGLKKSTDVHLNVTIHTNNGILSEVPETVPMSCPYRPHSSSVSHNVPPIQPKFKRQHVNVTEPPKPKYSMNIVKTPGNDTGRVVINITTKVEGARAKNCYAAAKDNQSNRLNLTDEHGCSINQLSVWKWNKDTGILSATFPLFTLINANETYIDCTVESCHRESECTRDCPRADSPRRKCKDKAN